MMVLDDPLTAYDLVLIARLVIGDPTLRVWTKKRKAGLRPTPPGRSLITF
jgi:hypothetical protein